MLRIAAVLVMATAGCVSRPPISAPEQCARRGMAMDGLVLTSGESVGVASSGRRVAWSRGSSYGEAVSCVRPRNKAEACEIEGALVSLQQKAKYETGPRNFLLFVGWAAFVVPGLVMYVVMDDGDDYAVEAEAAGEQARLRCMEAT
jgi:hypothetical protein